MIMQGFGINDPKTNFWIGNQYANVWPTITDVLSEWRSRTGGAAVWSNVLPILWGPVADRLRRGKRHFAAGNHPAVPRLCLQLDAAMATVGQCVSSCVGATLTDVHVVRVLGDGQLPVVDCV